MEEKTILYGLAGVSIIIAAVLFIYRSQLLLRLSDKQIEMIFGVGQQTEVELNAIEKTVVKLKTRYPALVFLVPAIMFAFLGFRVEQAKIGKEEWTINGNFVVGGSVEQPIWRDGNLMIHPTDVKEQGVDEKGGFTIRVAIPSGKTFEEMYQYFQYASFDKRYNRRVFPKKELNKYNSGNKEASLLTHVTQTARFYDNLPVNVLPEESEESNDIEDQN